MAADARCRRQGAALLEVLVALTILATAGAVVAAFASEAMSTIRRAREREAEMRRASALFDAVALWPREDLDRHLGDRQQGPWRLQVGRPVPTLYTVILRDSSGAREILRTAMHRAPGAPEYDRARH
jgi:type II secretory pathway pseudopilin PulG